MTPKVLRQIKHYKIITVMLVVAFLGTGFWVYKKFWGAGEETRYLLAAVEKGTLTVSVNGSGQVSASNQIEVKAKASGDAIYVGVSGGQPVSAGTLLLQLNAREAQKAVRDAEISLESARITLEKMKGKEEGDYSLRSSKEKAKDDLSKSYDDGFNTVSNAFLDLPGIISGLQDLLFGKDFGNEQNIDYYTNAVKNYDSRAADVKNTALGSYQLARQRYDQNFTSYKSVSRFSDTGQIESIINETYNTTKALAEAVKSTNNLIQFYKDVFVQKDLKPSAFADTHLATLSSYTDKTNKHLVNLLASRNVIQTNKEAIVGSAFDLASQELSVKQKENALLDAKEKLSDYFIRAPFDGTLAKINAKVGESVSANTDVATLITYQRMAEISLNEVDIAKIKIGQKVALTFDAVEGLTIYGKVAELDTVGTVSQGVVTYNIKVAFDTQDERVKPGMSVSASIVTDTRQDVLFIPNSAVKSQGPSYYVEIPDSSENLPKLSRQGVLLSRTPLRQSIVIGLANDSTTELISGLKEGDPVVVRTIQPQSQNTQTAPSLFPTGGRGIGGSGNFRPR